VVKNLAEKGMTLAQQGRYTGVMYSYIDIVKELGVNLELLENI